MFMGPLFFLLPMLIFWGLPIFFIARWAMRVQRALEARNTPTDVPTREQLDRLLDRVESLSDDVEGIRERQDFIERLLAPPKPSSAPATPGSGSAAPGGVAPGAAGPESGGPAS
jgi:hypothetical protein